MELTGAQRIEASREAVWQALNDPEILRQCIPGCQELQQSSPTQFTARVVLKIGPVKATFSGAVTLSDLDPPHGYRIAGEGQGGVAGFAKGGADVRLEAEPDGATRLTYSAQANVGGKIAQLGARLIDSTSRKLAGEFFTAFARVVAPDAVPAAASAAPPAMDELTP
ncbi:SRPBCC family protein [Ancylobacter sp.]|uniref:SRPBCC family protein n=1 Tax=Ancylobacter sp. TaxID=1872567 RepID=UPI003D0B2FED